MGAATSQTQTTRVDNDNENFQVQKYPVGGFNYNLCRHHANELQDCVDRRTLLIYICKCESCKEKFDAVHLQMKLCSDCSNSRLFQNYCAACSFKE